MSVRKTCTNCIYNEEGLCCYADGDEVCDNNMKFWKPLPDVELDVLYDSDLTKKKF